MHKKIVLVAVCIAAFAISGAAQTVTGNGTSGTVPVFNGTSTVTNSPISVSGGNVGIGTTNPAQKLDVEGGSIEIGGIQSQSGTSAITMFGSDGHWAGLFPSLGIWNWNGIVQGGDQGIVYSSGSMGTGAFVIAPWANATSGLRMDATGNVGIGTTSPSAKLEINGGLRFSGDAAGTVQTTAWTGVVCGGDYAESVDVTGDRTKYEPGDVLVIDPDVSGKFLKSVEPYSTSVTGIYSTKPGAVGRRQTTPKSPDEVPMALVGIVPTKVSAENGSIHRGDLLVTSSTLGYAMKGTDRSRLTGAVIGKALDNLETGRGVIEVVVTLQ